MFKDAVRVVIENRKASTSLLQRKLRIGYGRAARLIEEMEEQGIIGPADGARPREVLITSLDDIVRR
jgi:S-DNA-T family DNA segregation ATPase FtsK/SpoIIIE